MYDHRRHHQVIALVRVFGTTIENEDVASSELSFPITYCEGCLVHYPLAAINPQTDKIPSDSPRPARIHGHQRRERSRPNPTSFHAVDSQGRAPLEGFANAVRRVRIPSYV
jgi:hypothetical protein